MSKKSSPAVRRRQLFTKIITSRWFGRLYLAASVVLLLGSATVWSVLAAHLHAGNADQLADPYLFADKHSLQGAQFPVAHTFLIKWPVFALIAHYGVTVNNLMLATVACVLLTMSGLMIVLWRIERRPLVVGTLFLALASMLLMVPAQPYPGALLPLNMAMLATRNIEYIAYIAVLILLVRANKIRSFAFVSATLLLALLLASDQLFLGLSAGGALVAIVVYVFGRNWDVVSLATRWLVATGVALATSGAMVWLIALTGLTHFTGGDSANGYGAAHGAKQAVEGIIFGVLQSLANLGANPAAIATEFRQIPQLLQTNIGGYAGLAYVYNISAVAIGGWLSLRYFGRTIYSGYKNSRPNKLDRPAKLAVMLVASTVASIIIFASTNHQYAVDGRYVGIIIFALAVATVVATRRYSWQPERLVLTGVLACFAIVAGIYGTVQNHHMAAASMSVAQDRNALIAKAMAGRKSNVLVGDYWRVLPVKLASKNRLAVWPMASCTQPKTALISQSWRPDLHKGFVYLLSLDPSQTDFPHCSLDQIVSVYGKPSSSLAVAGGVTQPKELLLFYDNGINKRPEHPSDVPQKPASILPVNIEDLPDTSCEGPTIFNVVAHEDDDLLFLSPDLIHDIKDGYCVRTVYLTAGDGGNDKLYWLGRQQGSQAAYSTMTSSSAPWMQRVVKVADGQYVSLAHMRDNPKISLMFLNLPDGNPKGSGFGASHNASLAKLADGSISSIRSVDGQSDYTSDQLVSTLVKLMRRYQPAVIKTQSDVAGTMFGDHSDHLTVSHFASQARDAYVKQQFNGFVSVPLLRYIGYPIHERPVNVFDEDVSAKEAAFFAYAQHDPSTCRSMAECSRGAAVYGEYLTRQYQQ